MVTKDPYAQAGSLLFERPSDIRYPVDSGTGGAFTGLTAESDPLIVCDFTDPTIKFMAYPRFDDAGVLVGIFNSANVAIVEGVDFAVCECATQTSTFVESVCISSILLGLTNSIVSATRVLDSEGALLNTIYRDSKFNTITITDGVEIICDCNSTPYTIGDTKDHPFAITNALGLVELTITTETGADYDVTWGDGTVTTHASGTVASHTYLTPFTGDVVVSVGLPDAITDFNSTTAGVNWSFTAASLPVELKTIDLRGDNTFSGTTAELPTGMTSVIIFGSNTLSGDAAGFHPWLTVIYIQGLNTISGDVAGLPAGLTYLYITGQNTLSGDIAGLSSFLTLLVITGLTTVTGDIASLSNALTRITLVGSNAVFGDVGTLSPVLTSLDLQGLHTVSGDVANLPAGLINIRIEGFNTVSGDFASMPSTVTFLLIQGANTITATTTAWPFGTTFRRLILYGTVAKTFSDIDNILVAGQSVTNWILEKSVELAGINPSPTAIGDAARLVILGNGATTVDVN